jgi:N-methylhydantoinase A
MDYVIGIDVGGTFTDVVCSDGTTTWRAKAPTNPAQFSEGVLAGCGLIAGSKNMSLSDLFAKTVRFGLGTTAVTNVLATQRGHRVALLTTAGFESHLHTARGARKAENGWLTMPWNPVERDWVVGINERINRDGAVVRPLDQAQVRGEARRLIDDFGVDSFAISFLWSFKNPQHELEAAEVLRSAYPTIPVFCGSELRPVMREYERTTLAVLNAFTASALDGVEELETELRSLGLQAPILLLHSGGGAISVGEARAVPLGLASSGPAAGVVAAAEVARAAGIANALCCDMGGTSIDVAVVREGVPERCQSAEIQGIVTGQSAVDVESIGAGGGSLAWIDSRGLLRVGPQSARATPGPVCYGRGGTEPTVTDAMVLLGYIDPDRFMGGAMKLDVEAARVACARMGEGLGLSASEVAVGIRAIALAEMGKAVRARLATGGLDARKYSLIAFGGSGSLFAIQLAKELGMPAVLTPAVASVLSAYGAATADIRRERTQALDLVLPLDADQRALVDATMQSLRAKADADLALQGVKPADRTLISEVDVRLYRQKAFVTLLVEGVSLDADHLAQRFRDNYVARYGTGGLKTGSEIEISTVRVVGIGRTVRAVLPEPAERVEASVPRHRGERRVILDMNSEENVPVFDADTLRPGHVVFGPALIDAVDTTLWAPPKSRVQVVGGSSFLTSFDIQA